QGDFTDLCRGPHVESVKELKYFKLVLVFFVNVAFLCISFVCFNSISIIAFVSFLAIVRFFSEFLKQIKSSEQEYCNNNYNQTTDNT
ncbi:MAG: hypothetical protein K2P12_00090, partial [Clostridia bacterium]|nr:hypothetical protein [Clostridia bacterium]